MPSKLAWLKPTYAKSNGGIAEAERKRFYNGRAWRRLREVFLTNNPLCADCEAQGRLTMATTPHHVEERLKRPDLALDPENLIPLCASCHSKRHKSPKG